MFIFNFLTKNIKANDLRLIDIYNSDNNNLSRTQDVVKREKYFKPNLNDFKLVFVADLPVRQHAVPTVPTAPIVPTVPIVPVAPTEQKYLDFNDEIQLNQETVETTLETLKIKIETDIPATTTTEIDAIGSKVDAALIDTTTLVGLLTGEAYIVAVLDSLEAQIAQIEKVDIGIFKASVKTKYDQFISAFTLSGATTAENVVIIEKLKTDILASITANAVIADTSFTATKDAYFLELDDGTITVADAVTECKTIITTLIEDEKTKEFDALSLIITEIMDEQLKAYYDGSSAAFNTYYTGITAALEEFETAD